MIVIDLLVWPEGYIPWENASAVIFLNLGFSNTSCYDKTGFEYCQHPPDGMTTSISDCFEF